MTGIVAHTYPEWWLKLAGQVAHWSTDYSYLHRLAHKSAPLLYVRELHNASCFGPLQRTALLFFIICPCKF